MDFNHLTRFVKAFQPGSQFQNFKGSSCDGRWLLWGEFFPEPRYFGIGLNAYNKWEFYDLERKAQDLRSAPHPLILYVRAHLLNQRIAKAEVFESRGLKLHFLPQNASWLLKMEGEGILSSEIVVPGRKPFCSQLRLAHWPMPEAAKNELGASAQGSRNEVWGELKSGGGGELSGEGKEPEDRAPLVHVENTQAPLSPLDEQVKAALTEENSRDELAVARKKKLIGKVLDDVARAEKLLVELRPIIEILKATPMAWGDRDQFMPSQLAFIAKAGLNGDLPPFSKSNAGTAKDKIFFLNRKMIRKKEGALQRLSEVDTMALSAFRTAAKITKGRKNSAVNESSQIGRKVGLSGGIVAWVGKSAGENAELFRRARSRDLWFHVRGFAGGHVWIHRGQKGFGAKEEPSQRLILEGAKLALFNSKLRHSTRKGDVDITERRFLKTIKGAEAGKLEILRSETRTVFLDEEFEKLLNKK